jgi:hypothetical protein
MVMLRRMAATWVGWKIGADATKEKKCVRVAESFGDLQHTSN